MKKIHLVITCEHAVDTIPQAYRTFFAPHQQLLQTHRGIDFGALAIAEHLKNTIHCDFIKATASRLLIDCNRSLGNHGCFSEITESLPEQEKQNIIEQYYLPFREQVIPTIKKYLDQGETVWHFSIHSFTPVFNDILRKADIGLLYDPKRPGEKNIAKHLQAAIKEQNPAYRVRMNYPYRGTTDGFTTALRKLFPTQNYVGIEIESNQALTRNDKDLDALKTVLAVSLKQILYAVVG